ncbi:hypothetical protein GGX14DRAFT_573564 [Mycena pura]|uniref:F-box domain-containing protein n=1 Tax=Mycena pura TaxID=153505 RepID=A0AAD6Y9V1_9AGAR|nr:hypothetical protein GGX14DRAFT_573564 [Mycena pura]
MQFSFRRLAHPTYNTLLDKVVSYGVPLEPALRWVVESELELLRFELKIGSTYPRSFEEANIVLQTLERLLRVCPFRELPEDILYQIFGQCESMALESSESSWALFRVAEVSSGWRALALRLPSYAEYRMRSTQLNFHQMSRAISKTQGARQAFSLVFMLGAGVCVPTLLSLGLYFSRLVDLRISAVAASSGCLESLSGACFTSLQNCSIYLDVPVHQPLLTHSPFAGAYALRAFEVKCASYDIPPAIVDPCQLRLPWSNLEHLDLTGAHVDLAKLHVVLGFCQKLRRLNARCTSEITPTDRTRRLCMPQLRALRLYCPADDVALFFGSLVLPDLADLEIWSHDRWLTPRCLRALSPSVTVLRRLVVYGGCTTSALPALLHAAPNIQILVFRLVRFDKVVLRNLAYRGADPPLVPKLEVLAFGDCSVGDPEAAPHASLSAFLRVIESRYWTDAGYRRARPHIRRLVAALLCAREGSGDFTPSMIKRMDRLVGKGLYMDDNYDPAMDRWLTLYGDAAYLFDDDDKPGCFYAPEDPMDTDDGNLAMDGNFAMDVASWCSKISVNWCATMNED